MDPALSVFEGAVFVFRFTTDKQALRVISDNGSSHVVAARRMLARPVCPATLSALLAPCYAIGSA